MHTVILTNILVIAVRKKNQCQAYVKLNISKCGLVVNACNLTYMEGLGRRIKSSRSVWTKLERPYLKNKLKAKGLEI
jgi:hypothetical protein